MTATSELSRRSFVAATLGSATLLACDGPGGGAETDAPGTGTDTDPAPNDVVDVVVIGAGLSGLTAAQTLHDAGYTVRVLEARDQVGGRTLDWDVGNGAVAEGGAQWVGPSQTAILQLADDLGVQTFPAEVSGNTRYHFGGMRFDAPPEEPSAELRALRDQLDALAATVPVEAPWQAPNAATLDAQTVESWLMSQGVTTEVADEMRLSIAVWLGDTQATSLLYLAYYIASAGSVEALDTTAQRLRFVGGPQQLSTRMADALAEAVHLGTPVRRIEQHAAGVDVHTDDALLRARRVIVAMSPSDADRITFSPPLPEDRAELQSRWVVNPGVKQHLVFDTPFWRDRGLSGASVTDLPLTAITFDASPADASVGVLVVFPNDEALPSTEAQRRDQLVAEVDTLFGPDAPAPVGYYEKDWATEDWISGCVSPLPPGVLTSVGSALRVPADRVHWAGTETATQWTGYMDGAVRAGQRAAMEVSEALTADGA